jgi:hypothetical protein
MGQGIYRVVGFGCLNPPPFDSDNDIKPCLYDVLEMSCDCEPQYAMIPLAVDDRFLQRELNLPPLPAGLPHVEDRTARVVKRCRWWPDVGKKGVWVSRRIEAQWELIREVAKQRGWELPPGMVIFASDWD